MEKIMTLHINCYDSYEVAGKEETVRQILFDGTAEGDYFNGKILPGGVDTQRIKNGFCTLSARYILSGTDKCGNECKIFVENTLKTGEALSHPVMLTDSDCLSFLNNAVLSGKMINDSDDFRIEIYGDLTPALL